MLCVVLKLIAFTGTTALNQLSKNVETLANNKEHASTLSMMKMTASV
jgi:hypothetical protein